MEYWHWIALGIVLVIVEAFVPSFTIFWFGLAAGVVGALLWIGVPMELTAQIFAWAVLSCVFCALWFLVLKPRMRDKTTAGISREGALGQTGQVVAVPGPDGLGRVRFSTPLLGDDEWPMRCSDPVQLGDRVIVVDITGNTLVVSRKPSSEVL
jgi:membrane protein implicated in regulation of membrane protease activity